MFKSLILVFFGFSLIENTTSTLVTPIVIDFDYDSEMTRVRDVDTLNIESDTDNVIEIGDLGIYLKNFGKRISTEDRRFDDYKERTAKVDAYQEAIEDLMHNRQN